MGFEESTYDPEGILLEPTSATAQAADALRTNGSLGPFESLLPDFSLSDRNTRLPGGKTQPLSSPIFVLRSEKSIFFGAV